MNNKGFSFIEVLVVSAVIGVLAGIAISQYAVFTKKGQDAVVAVKARNEKITEQGDF